jgi:hypothetical protein
VEDWNNTYILYVVLSATGLHFIFFVSFLSIFILFYFAYFISLAPASRPTLEPTQPLIQWVPKGVKRGRGVTLTHPI